MADGFDTTATESTAIDLAAEIKSFATAHGGAKAVIEYVKRRGARIVVVGEDGEWTEQSAASTELARKACEDAGIEIDNEWERELIEHMRPSNDLWRSMGRRTLVR
jgi:hypothetical protein